MEILFFCPRWGSEDMPWDEFCKKVKAAGYDGIEYAIARDVKDSELTNAWVSAQNYGLQILPQHFDTREADFEEHYRSFEAWLKRIHPLPHVRINSQTGKDFFTFDQNRRLIELGNAYQVVHETHRGKFSFAAHITRPFLEQIPDLRLTLDISHWVNTAESLLEDQAEAVSLAIAKTDHIHARVGYAEGPQVTDPRSLTWQVELYRHLGWWDAVFLQKARSGERLTITPEFGPFPYMVHLPKDGSPPIANQWTCNYYMMKLLKGRYNTLLSNQSRYGHEPATLAAGRQGTS
ncbi:MAG: sugar phosphate isomerase/epimerase [Puia sp.]|nr:sugar phosphate isomerase/epimerase [Puia sp.]